MSTDSTSNSNLNDKIQRLNFALNAAGIGTWNLDPVNQLVEWDERCKELFGFSKEDVVQYQQVLQYIHPDDKAEVRKAVDLALQPDSNGYYSVQFRTIGAEDAKLRWLHCKGQAYFNEQGAAYLFSGTAQDITEMIHTREQAATSERLAALALEGASAGWFTIRLADNKMEHSIALAKIMTGTERTVDRAMLIQYVHPEDRSLRDMAYEIANGTGKLKYQVRFIWDDGSIHWVRVTGTYQYETGGNPYFFAGIAQDITAEMNARKQLESNEERFRSIVEQAPVATCLFVGRDMKIEVANDIMIGYWGKDKSVIGKPLKEAVPELTGQPFLDILDEVFTTGKTHEAKSTQAELAIDGILRTYYFDFTYKPLFNAVGEVYAIMDMAVDVTQQVIAKQQIEESQQQLLALFEQSPVAIAIISAGDMVFRMVNSFYGTLVGRTSDQLIGKSLLEALPELYNQGFDQLLNQVVTTGVPYIANEVAVDIIRQNQLETIYVDLTYQPQRRIDNTISGIFVVATDVTQQVRSRKTLEASEAKLRSIIATAPAAMGLFVGRDLIVELPNRTFLDIVGKGDTIEGKPLREVMPELISENQPFLQILDQVYTSGIMYQSFGTEVDIVQHGVMTHNFYNITYTPLLDSDGNVYAILDIAIDVTEEVKARKKLEETEIRLRGAIELAKLSTWSMDIATGHFTYSDRFMDWLGFSEATKDMDAAYNPLPDHYRQSVPAAIEAIIQPGSSGMYDNEHPIVNQLTGQVRIIHAQGVVLYDAEGTPKTLTGTAQDITEQKKLQQELEHLVQLRTEELASTNEELQATNEEIATTNEELAEANIQLLHSNEELGQYAYVASHDLQEPLRKIRIFSSILSRGASLSEEQIALINKITGAAERMSLLIQNLLEFSRLLKADTLMRPIDLKTVLADVATDFEITIEEKKANLFIGTLPVIEAVSLQMNQLFYNLLSNALKFTRPHISPRIQVDSREVTHAEVKQHIPNPLAFARYYHISFADNGIGLDSEYAEQIFEVFKRLHERDLYPGSGIGLALCRRIISNHNGYMYVESEVNKGTTFHILLPDRNK